MFRKGLFARMFAAFLAAMLAVACAFSLLLAEGMKQSAQESYEREVTMQAREVASFLEYMSQLTSIRANDTLYRMLTEKIKYINETYSADIWLVSYRAGTVQYLDNNLNTSFGLFSDQVTEQLDRVALGEEIRVNGMFPDLGAGIVTIGVPWTYTDGTVVGAVLLHISVESLTVNYASLLGKIWPPLLISVALAVVTSYFIARSQSRHIRRIGAAVGKFSKGDFSSRVSVQTGDELQELAESFNKMADELSQLEQSRRSFVAAVSHELRSPLTCIRGYIQGILDGTIEGEDEKKYLGVVLSESVRLTDLVRDLLDLSRLESGAFPLEVAPFDVCEMLRRTLIPFEKRIDEKNCRVEAEIPESAVYVEGDVSRIRQVASNLIDNALKYGGDTLWVGVRAAGDQWEIYVRDDGAGISPEDLPHIFERFYKADKAHTSGNGTGLGLSISSRIVEQHGSSIKVASEVGRGTEFSFALPAAASQISG